VVFRQIVHDDLGCASYLIGDENAGVAAVVDPKLDIDEYLALARYVGVDIAHVLETHNHADHVSGHGRLAAATGATIHVHREAQVDYEHVPFDDGFELELGMLRVRAIHTPGHRPEHTSFALVDTSRGTEPWAVLTGDSLFVGDIARPDLAVEKQDGAIRVKRELEDGWFQHVEMPLPALLTIQSGINKLRYATLMGIKKAKTKEVKRLTTAELGGAGQPAIRFARVYLPEKTKRSQIFDGPPKEAAAKLVEKLKFEARVL
jgi:hypothetical protein